MPFPLKTPRLPDAVGWLKPTWAEWPDDPDDLHVIREIAKCKASPHYFIRNYCSIYAATESGPDGGEESDPLDGGGEWIRFDLWESQDWPLQVIHTKRRSIHLKARQIGMTWTALAYVLWMLLFLDRITALLFSRGDREALDLMKRLKEMSRRLPPWMLPNGLFDRKGRITGSSGHQWQWPDGARVMAFPATAGDSYQASFVLIDEADLVPDLNKLMASVKATIDNGGKLVMVSKSNKSKPDSPFKRIFRAAKQGLNGFEPVFLPWWAHPQRTQKWYKSQVDYSMTTTFALDFVKGEFPRNWSEAIEANQLDKRFPESVLKHVFKDAEDLCNGGESRPFVEVENPNATGDDDRMIRHYAPDLPGLRIYKLPQPGGSVTIGVDPAQGLPQSNDSAIVGVDDFTGEEVFHVRGKIPPRVLGRYSSALCDFYRKQPGARSTVAIERNNHGHAVISWWRDNVESHNFDASMWLDADGERGWVQTGQKKELMYHRAADKVSRRQCLIHSQDLYAQITTIEANTLEAPEGTQLLDDSAVAWGIAIAVSSTKKRVDWSNLKLDG